MDVYEAYKRGYEAGYFVGYGDGLRNTPPDSRTLTERLASGEAEANEGEAENGRIQSVIDDQHADK